MERAVRWEWGSLAVTVGVDQAGAGSSVVLLPALSSISTRREMRPLFERLSSHFRVATVDWPGFGNRARPRSDWSPEILSAFLAWFLSDIVPPPHAVVAAGHAATYALYQAAHRRGTIKALALIAPTWRGPLPTMMGGRRAWFARVRTAIDHPIAGPLLYRLNLSRLVVKKMGREHVYSDPAWLTQSRLAAKRGVIRTPGARHGSVRFVTGSLDRVDSREAFVDLARKTNVPTVVVYGEETPPKSRAEMDVLATALGAPVERLSAGKLGIHEEFPDEVAGVIVPFFKKAAEHTPAAKAGFY